jgi:hypothetical protein
MIKPLHPTLKACRCGFIGPRSAFYKHLDFEVKNYTAARLFFLDHGEVPLNSDDPRLADLVPMPTLTEKRRDLINNL